MLKDCEPAVQPALIFSVIDAAPGESPNVIYGTNRKFPDL
jgi:hypothetical protein